MKLFPERRLKRPSPCRIRSAPGRDRVRGLSETSEKCAKFCILGGIRPRYCWILAYSELEQKKHNMGEHLFPSWHHFQILASYLLISSPQFCFHGHTSKRLAYCRATAMSLLFYIRFHGHIPLFERSLSSRRGVPYQRTPLHPVSVPILHPRKIRSTNYYYVVTD